MKGKLKRGRRALATEPYHCPKCGFIYPGKRKKGELQLCALCKRDIDPASVRRTCRHCGKDLIRSNTRGCCRECRMYEAKRSHPSRARLGGKQPGINTAATPPDHDEHLLELQKRAEQGLPLTGWRRRS